MRASARRSCCGARACRSTRWRTPPGPSATSSCARSRRACPWPKHNVGFAIPKRPAMSNEKPLYVTQPTLPALEEFIPYLERIWESRILTNSGPFHAELENALCDYLGVRHISLFNNGTIALLVALR